jgi:hypothetical protein
VIFLLVTLRDVLPDVAEELSLKNSQRAGERGTSG